MKKLTMTKKRNLFITLLILLAGTGILLMAMILGQVNIAPSTIVEALFHGTPESVSIILYKLRIPRILMALIIGASLGASGVLYQALLKNPLAEPFTLGISSGAACGAAFAIIMSLSTGFIFAGAFAGSIFVILLVYLLARKFGFSSPALILGGLSLSFIFSSAVLLLFAFSSADQVHKALMWLMGDLSLARYDYLGKSAIALGALLIITLLYSRHLNILSFGDDFAASHGITSSEILIIFWVASMLAAISVSLAGVIGFIGLITPHAVRVLSGPEHRVLLPVTAVTGGLLLVMADTMGRTMVSPYEIPAGIIMGFFGGIFFLVILLKRGWSG